MTVALMRLFGAEVLGEGAVLTVQPGSYRPTSYTVESDWSAASYWYSMVALGPSGSEITLPGLRRQSLQGDQAIAEMMTHFGVETAFLPDGVHLQQQPIPPREPRLTLDFADCPDLAQTVAVVAAALTRPVEMTGLESLRIKETDRIAALQMELTKFGGNLRNIGGGHFRAESSGFSVDHQSVATYHDHRMAMAFAPLALLGSIHIQNPGVVRKSYPRYWPELAKIGFVISEAD
jgi:3-phosphoshikimate 1-carboxyvinyltransferase